jgi:hypothetical protein
MLVTIKSCNGCYIRAGAMTRLSAARVSPFWVIFVTLRLSQKLRRNRQQTQQIAGGYHGDERCAPTRTAWSEPKPFRQSTALLQPRFRQKEGAHETIAKLSLFVACELLSAASRYPAVTLRLQFVPIVAGPARASFPPLQANDCVHVNETGCVYSHLQSCAER